MLYHRLRVKHICTATKGLEVYFFHLHFQYYAKTSKARFAALGAMPLKLAPNGAEFCYFFAIKNPDAIINAIPKKPNTLG
jgi:hypothetical protein